MPVGARELTVCPNRVDLGEERHAGQVVERGELLDAGLSLALLRDGRSGCKGREGAGEGAGELHLCWNGRGNECGGQ